MPSSDFSFWTQPHKANLQPPPGACSSGPQTGENDLLIATLGLLGAGAQVGAADDILMVTRPGPGVVPDQKETSLGGCYGLPQELEEERTGAMPTPTSCFTRWSVDSVIITFPL